MHGASVTVLLADDSDMMSKAIRSVLSLEPKIDLLGEARTLPEAVKMAALLRPNVILLDLHMPDGEGFEPSIVKVELLSCTDRIIAMSMLNDGATKALAQAYGASILLDKVNLGIELVPTLLSTRH